MCVLVHDLNLDLCMSYYDRESDLVILAPGVGVALGLPGQVGVGLVGGRPVHHLTLVDPHLGAEEYVSTANVKTNWYKCKLKYEP
jgi:hypothetical protein